MDHGVGNIFRQICKHQQHTHTVQANAAENYVQIKCEKINLRRTKSAPSFRFIGDANLLGQILHNFDVESYLFKCEK